MQTQSQSRQLNIAPYAVISKGFRFVVRDTRTGNEGLPQLTRGLAEQDAVSLKIRNMMHS